MDVKDEEDFDCVRVRMMTFQEDEIIIAMAWRHETLTMQNVYNFIDS